MKNGLRVRSQLLITARELLQSGLAGAARGLRFRPCLVIVNFHSKHHGDGAAILLCWGEVPLPHRVFGIGCFVDAIDDRGRKQAWKLAQEHLRPLNQGKVTSLSDVTFGEFIERHFVPNFLATLKLSTQKRCLQTFKNHLLPAFVSVRLCEIGPLELQRLVLAKMHAGLGWESCDHLRNLMSKVFAVAKGWNFLAGENPVSAVVLPQKQLAEEKKILSLAQIQALLSILLTQDAVSQAAVIPHTPEGAKTLATGGPGSAT